MHTLGLPEDTKVNPAYVHEVQFAAAMENRCRSCQKTGKDTTDCVQYKVRIDDNGCAGSYAVLCPKVEAYRRQLRVDKLTQESQMSRRFLKRRFETFKVTPDTSQAYNVCRDFALFFKPYRKGLRIMGDCGCGKTHLAAAILNDLRDREIVSAFIVVPEFLEMMKQSFNDKTLEPKVNGIIDAIKTVPLLVLDDLGAEKKTDFTLEQLYNFINVRYENELTTIITTNLNTRQLEEQIGKRTQSRLIEMTDGLTIKAADYRLSSTLERNDSNEKEETFADFE